MTLNARSKYARGRRASVASRHQTSQSGFTALELLVALTIAGLLTAIAVPKYLQMVVSNHKTNALDDLEFDLRRAKSEALAQGVRTVLSTNGGGTSYTIGYDYPPYNSPPAADTALLTRELQESVTVTPSATALFDSRGFLTDEDGAPTTVAITLSWYGSSYCTVSVQATGAISQTCSNS